MKKLVMGLSLFFLMTACNQDKVAFINVDEILKEYKGALEAEKEIQEESQRISSELQQMTLSFQAKYQSYQESNGSMPADERQRLEQELMQEQQQIQMRQQMVQQQMQAMSQAKIEELNQEIESYLEEYAMSNGYSYILGTSQQTKAVMYGKPSLNITEEVLEALNDDFESVEITEDLSEDSSVSSEEVKTENKEEQPE